MILLKSKRLSLFKIKNSLTLPTRDADIPQTLLKAGMKRHNAEILYIISRINT